MNKKIITLAGVVIIAVALVLIANYFWQTRTWKTINGCVSYEGKNYEYSFAGKRNWHATSADMGCGTSYDEAQTWGLVDHKVGDKKRTIGQISVLVSVVKPNSPDDNAFRYVALPDRDIYVEVGRITGEIDSKTFGVTDQQWQKIKDSFQFN